MSAIMSTIDAPINSIIFLFLAKDLYLSAKPEMAKNQRKISWLSSLITLGLTALLILAA